MGGNIKGVTIEFRGDTTSLDKALRTINKELRTTQNELTATNKALKFNPTNVDLWKNKQQLLSTKIKETEERLDTLKKAQAQMDAEKVDKTSEEYMRLQREIIETEAKLKTFNAELKSIGNANIRALGEELKKVGDRMKEVGTTMTKYVTAPIVAVYGAGTKAALTYGDAIAKMSTIADSGQVPIEDLSKSILDLSNKTGIGASELAEAAYQALSASVETKDVVSFLTDASGLAKAGFLDTADAVDVLTTIINAYGYSAEDANLIANELIQTQNDGKTTVNELAQAMGQVIPTASALNIPLEQLNAAYVILTKQGINTANSTTYLNGMFTELADGGSQVSQILQEKTGMTFGQLMASGASLGDVMGILNEAVDGDSEAFLNLWGNTRAGKGALAILNGGIDEFNSEAAKMADSTGNVEDALDKLATPGAAARKALNQLVNVGIQIGDVLAPYVQKAATFIQKLIDKFNGLSPQAKKIAVIVGAIVAAIGPLLVAVGSVVSTIGSLLIFLPMIGATIGSLAIPIAVIIGIIFTVVRAFIFWKKHGEQIKKFFTAFGKAIAKAFTNMKNKLVTVFNAIKTVATTVWNAIKTVITTVVTAIVTLIQARFNLIKTVVTTVLNAIKTVVTTVWNAIKTVITTVITAIQALITARFQLMQNVITTTFNAIKSVVTSIWNGIKSAITNAVNGAHSAVAGRVSAISSTVSSTFNSIKSTATSIWNGIKSAITSPIESAKNTISGIMSKIKDFFPINIGKLINFSIPKISLNTASKTVLGKTITYPTGFSVSWHKQGAIFARPTLLPGMDGMMHGVGDVRGGEAVLPIEKLQTMIDKGMANNNDAALRQAELLLLNEILKELKKEKNFKIDDRYAGRYVRGLGFVKG